MGCDLTQNMVIQERQLMATLGQSWHLFLKQGYLLGHLKSVNVISNELKSENKKGNGIDAMKVQVQNYFMLLLNVPSLLSKLPGPPQVPPELLWCLGVDACFLLRTNEGSKGKAILHLPFKGPCLQSETLICQDCTKRATSSDKLSLNWGTKSCTEQYVCK